MPCSIMSLFFILATAPAESWVVLGYGGGLVFLAKAGGQLFGAYHFPAAVDSHAHLPFAVGKTVVQAVEPEMVVHAYHYIYAVTGVKDNLGC